MSRNDCCHIQQRYHEVYATILEAYLEKKYHARKTALFTQMAAHIVEIGPGPGTNFQYYPKHSQVIAIEPNPAMHHRLREHALKQEINVDIRGHQGEHLDIPTASIDVVVGTLLLCSVGEPTHVLSEIQRVLKRGGVYYFLEHVAAPPGTIMSGVQTLLSVPWKWLFDGCHVTRQSEHLIRTYFPSCEVEHFTIAPRWLPITYHILGRARKPRRLKP